VRVPISWLRDHVDLVDIDPREVANRLTHAGLQVERVESFGAGISGVVVAAVVAIEDVAGHKKPIRWVTLSDGADERQVICGATNFRVGDLVAYARPPATLPGGFDIGARKTYGHVSDGMICSGRELGISDDHDGILVLDPGLSLGADVVTALELRDDVLDISVNPDRGYALSVRGIAREVAIAFGRDFTDPADLAVPPAGTDGYAVRIDAPEACTRYVARTLSALDPDVPSPAWISRRLVMAGMRPISLMVDITNYVMLDLGQPLHAFDRARLHGPIVVRWAHEGESLRTLDAVDRALDSRDLVIADDSGPIALAGVMGGESTEISAATTDVVLEAAWFDPVPVSYTSRRHRLASEASRRFERGVDDNLAPSAAERALSMMASVGAATASTSVTDADHRRERQSIVLDPDLPGRIAGVAYPAATVERRLADVGCAVATSDTTWTVVPPSWRPDLRIDVDLVEEVARLEGYQNLPSTVPKAPAGRGLSRPQRLRRRVGRALADAGFSEVVNAPFVDLASAERLMICAGDPRVPSVRIANPVSEEEPYLRSSLLPGLFGALRRNLGRGFTDVALFEMGPVFRSSGSAAPPDLTVGVAPTVEELALLDAALPAQPARMAAVLAGARERPGWWGPGRPASVYDAIAAVETVGRAVGVDVVASADQHAPFHPGRCAALHIDGTLLGHAGELHPRVTEACDLPAGTVAMEISSDVLFAHDPGIVAAPVVSAYPLATIDIAVVVDEAIAAADVEAALRAGAGELLESIRLFDVFTGAQVGPGRRSLAFTLHLRALDRTLTAADAVAVRDAALAEATLRCGAELR